MKRTNLVLMTLMMLSVYAAGMEVFNHGTPGVSVAALKDERLQKTFEAKPDLVILLAGTNDTVNSAALLSPSDFGKQYERVVQLLLDSKIAVIPVTLPPCNEDLLLKRHPLKKFGYLSPNARIMKINELIKSIAEKNRLPLLDFHAEVQKNGTSGINSLIRNPENNGGTDGVYLTPEGCRRLAEMIFQLIHSNGISAKRIVCLGDSLTYGVNVRGAGTVEGDTYPAQLLLLFKESSGEKQL